MMLYSQVTGSVSVVESDILKSRTLGPLGGQPCPSGFVPPGAFCLLLNKAQLNVFRYPEYMEKDKQPLGWGYS